MSTTPEDNKPAVEPQTPAAPSAETPVKTEQPADEGNAKMLAMMGAVIALGMVALVVFHFVDQGSERTRVYGEGRPLEEITKLQQEQQQFLAGQNPAGKTLEQAMAEALR